MISIFIILILFSSDQTSDITLTAKEKTLANNVPSSTCECERFMISKEIH